MAKSNTLDPEEFVTTYHWNGDLRGPLSPTIPDGAVAICYSRGKSGPKSGDRVQTLSGSVRVVWPIEKRLRGWTLINGVHCEIWTIGRRLLTSGARGAQYI